MERRLRRGSSRSWASSTRSGPPLPAERWSASPIRTRVHEPQHPGGSRARPRPLGPATGRRRAGLVGPGPGWGQGGRLRDTRVADLALGSLQELNGLPAPLREGLYGRLIPPEVCARFGVDPATGLNGAGHRLLRVFAPPEQSWARIELRASRDDRDPLVLVDVEMGPFAVPELSFVQVTDPDAERFAIDRDEDGAGHALRHGDPQPRRGASRARGGTRPGPGAAWTAAPRSGAGLDGRLLPAAREGAVPGGAALLPLGAPLRAARLRLPARPRADGRRSTGSSIRAAGCTGRSTASTAFRQPGFARTIRGRSWAIHDGILGALDGMAWGGVKMYRLVGRPASVSTFPAAAY